MIEIVWPSGLICIFGCGKLVWFIGAFHSAPPDMSASFRLRLFTRNLRLFRWIFPSLAYLLCPQWEHQSWGSWLAYPHSLIQHHHIPHVSGLGLPRDSELGSSLSFTGSGLCLAVAVLLLGVAGVLGEVSGEATGRGRRTLPRLWSWKLVEKYWNQKKMTNSCCSN